jgi:uncharacterized protein
VSLIRIEHAVKLGEMYRSEQRRLAGQRCLKALEDEPGPWTAWRVWSIIEVEGEPRLGSPFLPSRRYWWRGAREDWPIAEPMGELLESGDASDPSITGAGVYAGVTRIAVCEFAEVYLLDCPEPGTNADLYILGLVALWGRRLQARPGTAELRFEFGYPVELHGIEDRRDIKVPAPEELRNRLRDLYRLDDGSGRRDALRVSADQLRADLRFRYGDKASGWAHLPGTHALMVEPVSAGSGHVDLQRFLAAFNEEPTDGSSPLHAGEHSRQVAAFAVTLARETCGADPLVALLFGLLHDAGRRSDGHDPEHGYRAAELARSLNGGPFQLTDAQMRRLIFALELHAEGLLSAEPTIGCCWDADRLGLWRVHRRPAPSLLSTEAARERIGWAREHGIPTWRELTETSGPRALSVVPERSG